MQTKTNYFQSMEKFLLQKLFRTEKPEDPEDSDLSR